MSTWRPGTSRWPAGSSPRSPTGCPRTSAPTTPWPSSASSPSAPRRTSSSCPNISASVPQLKAAIAELQSQGFDAARVPRRPADRRGARRPRPLRQGQGQRGQPGAPRGQLRPPRTRLGQELRAQPPALDGRVVARSRRPTSSHMTEDDFRSNEKSHVMAADGTLRIEHTDEDGHHDRAARVGPGARRRGRRRHRHAGREAAGVPPREQIERAKDEDVLFSVHLKATMMKVSDPIIFGHVVETFLPRGLRAARRRAGEGRPLLEQRARRDPQRARQAPRGRARQPSRPRSARGSTTVRGSRWSTPTRGSPTCTSPATSSSTPRCRR